MSASSTRTRAPLGSANGLLSSNTAGRSSPALASSSFLTSGTGKRTVSRGMAGRMKGKTINRVTSENKETPPTQATKKQLVLEKEPLSSTTKAKARAPTAAAPASIRSSKSRAAPVAPNDDEFEDEADDADAEQDKEKWTRTNLSEMVAKVWSCYTERLAEYEAKLEKDGYTWLANSRAQAEDLIRQEALNPGGVAMHQLLKTPSRARLGTLPAGMRPVPLDFTGKKGSKRPAPESDAESRDDDNSHAEEDDDESDKPDYFTTAKRNLPIDSPIKPRPRAASSQAKSLIRSIAASADDSFSGPSRGKSSRPTSKPASKRKTKATSDKEEENEEPAAITINDSDDNGEDEEASLAVKASGKHSKDRESQRKRRAAEEAEQEEERQRQAERDAAEAAEIEAEMAAAEAAAAEERARAEAEAAATAAAAAEAERLENARLAAEKAAEVKARAEAEAQAKAQAAAEAKAKAEAEAAAAEEKERKRVERERKAAEKKRAEEEKAREREAEVRRKRAEKEAKERAEAEKRAQEELERKEREEAERKKREVAERKRREKEEAERKRAEMAAEKERVKKEEAERKRKEEAERKRREQKERVERERREAEEARAQAEAEAAAEAERLAAEKEEEERQARLAAEAEDRARAAEKARVAAAQAQAEADAAAEAEAQADDADEEDAGADSEASRAEDADVDVDVDADAGGSDRSDLSAVAADDDIEDGQLEDEAMPEELIHPSASEFAVAQAVGANASVAGPAANKTNQGTAPGQRMSSAVLQIPGASKPAKWTGANVGLAPSAPAATGGWKKFNLFGFNFGGNDGGASAPSQSQQAEATAALAEAASAPPVGSNAQGTISSASSSRTGSTATLTSVRSHGMPLISTSKSGIPASTTRIASQQANKTGTLPKKKAGPPAPGSVSRKVGPASKVASAAGTSTIKKVASPLKKLANAAASSAGARHAEEGAATTATKKRKVSPTVQKVTATASERAMPPPASPMRKGAAAIFAAGTSKIGSIPGSKSKMALQQQQAGPSAKIASKANGHANGNDGPFSQQNDFQSGSANGNRREDGAPNGGVGPSKTAATTAESSQPTRKMSVNDAHFSSQNDFQQMRTAGPSASNTGSASSSKSVLSQNKGGKWVNGGVTSAVPQRMSSLVNTPGRPGPSGASAGAGPSSTKSQRKKSSVPKTPSIRTLAKRRRYNDPNMEDEDVSLPDIQSEYSDSEDEMTQRKRKREAEWMRGDGLEAALHAQLKYNADELFGDFDPNSPPDLNRMMPPAAGQRPRHIPRSSSAIWANPEQLMAASMERRAQVQQSIQQSGAGPSRPQTGARS